MKRSDLSDPEQSITPSVVIGGMIGFFIRVFIGSLAFCAAADLTNLSL